MVSRQVSLALSRSILIILILALTWISPFISIAQELIMFESEECPWCDQWNEEVGVIYEKTEEGRRLPLRRIDFYAGLPSGIELSEPVRFTPTFVVVKDDREIGRINGYPGEANFWGLLEALIRRLGE